MSDENFLTPEQFDALYGKEMGRKSLVCLTEAEGEFFWKREPDGWYRLDS